MLSAQTGFTQSFNTCTGQTVLSITGATTSTVQNLTGSPVNIRITARGGEGGRGATLGGKGATMIGDFVLDNNATLRAISGASGSSGQTNGNGGGGSGAVNCGNPIDCASGMILIIAAGGGGGGINGVGGSASTGGSGAGGPGSLEAGGGGGINGNGNGGDGGGKVLKTGLSVNVGLGTLGMGGGGGGVFFEDPFGGGGGGHTGGGVSLPASSFNSGDSQINIDGLDGQGFGLPGRVNVVCLSLALPVELVDFKAAVSQGKVALQWQTASELNNLGYQVQRSPDARNWKDLGFVAGAGTTQEEQRYAFTDDGPLPGINYYRLRQTDFDGSSEYSPILVANLGFASKALTFFPTLHRKASLRSISRKPRKPKLCWKSSTGWATRYTAKPFSSKVAATCWCRSTCTVSLRACT